MKISIIMNSRVDGNPNHMMSTFLHSLVAMSYDLSNFEVLICYDDDDIGATEEMAVLSGGTWPFRLAWTTKNRGRGYLDLHHGYTKALALATPETQIVGAMCDDFIVHRHWDKILIDSIPNPDMFILHHRPHPPSDRPDYGSNPYHFDFGIDNMDKLYITGNGKKEKTETASRPR